MATTKKAPPFAFPPVKAPAGKVPAKAPGKPAMKKGKC